MSDPRSPSPLPLDRSFLASRDPKIDWETSQKHGLFSMAADLIRDHVTHLRAGAETNVISLDKHRKERT